MADPLDLSPAVVGMLRGLLHRPEVEAVQLDKGAPVRVGVRRDGAFRWFHGRSLFSALLLAEGSDAARVEVVEEELP